MLTDEVIIKIEAGKGGDGLVSFRHEKNMPKGGPDGGDGGDGGDIIFKVNNNLNTLTFFNSRKQFKAENGENGKKNEAKGKDGKDLILNVPPGTLIFEIQDGSAKKIIDLKSLGQDIDIAMGGRGGWGNVHFATSTHQVPREANPGTVGEKKTLKLELRLIADVGLIGLPNCGKSTLISRISKAKPKIANYPFTTLEPNLGVVTVDKDFDFIAADIPGLIEGASKGKGLGDKFLRHIKRTGILVHLIDINSDDLAKDYKTIRDELKLFSPELAEKKEIIVLNKIDTIDEKELTKKIKKFKLKIKKRTISISAVTGSNVKDLLYEIKKEL